MMEQYGLELVVSEDDSVSYEWSVTDVWRDPTKDVYFVYEGAGCSCNYPYENVYGVSDLGGPYTAAQVLHEVSYTLKERLIRAGV